jgi:hypothetical protein
VRKAGDDGRGERYGEDIRDWNLRSNGLKDGVGLLKPGLEANDGSTLLLGEAEDMKEPYTCIRTTWLSSISRHT